MRLKSIKNLEIQVLSIAWACTFKHDPQEVYMMETKMEYLLDSGNILNMFETQKY